MNDNSQFCPQCGNICPKQTPRTVPPTSGTTPPPTPVPPPTPRTTTPPTPPLGNNRKTTPKSSLTGEAKRTSPAKKLLKVVGGIFAVLLAAIVAIALWPDSDGGEGEGGLGNSMEEIDRMLNARPEPMEHPFTGNSRAISKELMEGFTVTARENAFEHDTDIKMRMLNDEEYMEAKRNVTSQLPDETLLLAYDVDAGLQPDERIPGYFQVEIDMAKWGVPEILWDDLRVCRKNRLGGLDRIHCWVENGKLCYRTNQNSWEYITFAYSAIKGVSIDLGSGLGVSLALPTIGGLVATISYAYTRWSVAEYYGHVFKFDTQKLTSTFKDFEFSFDDLCKKLKGGRDAFTDVFTTDALEIYVADQQFNSFNLVYRISDTECPDPEKYLALLNARAMRVEYLRDSLSQMQNIRNHPIPSAALALLSKSFREEFQKAITSSATLEEIIDNDPIINKLIIDGLVLPESVKSIIRNVRYASRFFDEEGIRMPSYYGWIYLVDKVMGGSGAQYRDLVTLFPCIYINYKDRLITREEMTVKEDGRSTKKIMKWPNQKYYNTMQVNVAHELFHRCQREYYSWYQVTINQRFCEATADVFEVDLAMRMKKDNIIKGNPLDYKYATRLRRKKAQEEKEGQKKEEQEEAPNENVDFTDADHFEWLNTALTANVSPDLKVGTSEEEAVKMIRKTLEDLYKAETELGTKPKEMSDEEWKKKVEAHKAEIQTWWHKIKNVVPNGFILEKNIVADLAGVVGNDVYTWFLPIDPNTDCGYMLGEFILYLRNATGKTPNCNQLMLAYKGKDFAAAMRKAFDLNDWQLFEHYQGFCQKNMEEILPKQKAMRRDNQGKKDLDGIKKYVQEQFYEPLSVTPDHCINTLSGWRKVGMDCCRTAILETGKDTLFNLAFIYSKDFDDKARRAVNIKTVGRDNLFGNDSIFYDMEKNNGCFPRGIAVFVTPGFNDLWFGLDTWKYRYYVDVVAFFQPKKKPTVSVERTGVLHVNTNCVAQPEMALYGYLSGMLITVVNNQTGDSLTLPQPVDFLNNHLQTVEADLDYSQLRLDPRKEIDINVSTRWYYVLDKTKGDMAYSPASEATHFKYNPGPKKEEQSTTAVSLLNDEYFVCSVWRNEKRPVKTAKMKCIVKDDGSFEIRVPDFKYETKGELGAKGPDVIITYEVTGFSVKGKGQPLSMGQDTEVLINEMSTIDYTIKKRHKGNIIHNDGRGTITYPDASTLDEDIHVRCTSPSGAQLTANKKEVRLHFQDDDGVYGRTVWGSK